jgi:hypothetical protein
MNKKSLIIITVIFISNITFGQNSKPLSEILTPLKDIILITIISIFGGFFLSKMWTSIYSGLNNGLEKDNPDFVDNLSWSSSKEKISFYRYLFLFMIFIVLLSFWINK